MANKEETRIVAQGNGTNGKIIVTANKYRKVIPAVLFSAQDAKKNY